jgi:hypothetical protein
LIRCRRWPNRAVAHAGRPADRIRRLDRPLHGTSAAWEHLRLRGAPPSRLAHLSAGSSTLTGNIHEKPDRGLAPCQTFHKYSLTADPPRGGSICLYAAERAWRMTRSGGAASHARTVARTTAAGTPRYALAPRGLGARRAPPRRVQARRHRRGAGRLGITPLFFPNLLSARRTPYVESMRRRGAAISFGRGTKRGRGGGGGGRMRRSRDAGGRRKWNRGG